MISGEFENGLRTVEDQLRKNGNEREEQCWNDEIARESSHCAECRKWTIEECEWTFEMNRKMLTIIEKLQILIPKCWSSIKLVCNLVNLDDQ